MRSTSPSTGGHSSSRSCRLWPPASSEGIAPAWQAGRVSSCATANAAVTRTVCAAEAARRARGRTIGGVASPARRRWSTHRDAGAFASDGPGIRARSGRHRELLPHRFRVHHARRDRRISSAARRSIVASARRGGRRAHHAGAFQFRQQRIGRRRRRTRHAGESESFRATPGAFGALGIRLEAGRLFDDRDRADGPPVAVVDDRFAKLMFGGATALGRRVRLDRTTQWMEIVGVVDHIAARSLDESAQMEIYLPLFASSFHFTAIVARSSGPDPLASVPAMRRRPARLGSGPAALWRRTDGELIHADRRPRAARRIRVRRVCRRGVAARGNRPRGRRRLFGDDENEGAGHSAGARRASGRARTRHRPLRQRPHGWRASSARWQDCVAGRGMSSLLVGIEPFDPLVLGWSMLRASRDWNSGELLAGTPRNPRRPDRRAQERLARARAAASSSSLTVL